MACGLMAGACSVPSDSRPLVCVSLGVEIKMSLRILTCRIGRGS